MCAALCTGFTWGAAGASGAQSGHRGHGTQGTRPELGMAVVIDPQARIWTLNKESTPDGDFAVLRHSDDGGKTWSARQRINGKAEPIWGSSESRPNLLLGGKGAMFATWIRPGTRNFAGDVRFARSLDGGRTWSAPVTVHHDQQPITHRFASMADDAQGRLYVAWIDRRDSSPDRSGSVYYAVSNDQGATWKGDYKLAGSSCECCRISLVSQSSGAPLALWRYVFEGSERDHALALLSPDGKPGKVERATSDHWKVEACPHHGPALALGQDGGSTVRHAVWFSQDGDDGRVYYGRLAGGGKVEGKIALPDGAEHADIAASGSQVWMAWKRFDGDKTVAGISYSRDGGRSWLPQDLASTAGGSDYPRLVLQGERALLAWNTERDGVILKPLP